MMAVISTGGKQYLVKEGDTIRVETLSTDEGKEVVFNTVLLVAKEDGSTVTVGTPIVAQAVVKGTVVQHGRGEKVTVKKFKSKIRYKRTYGHRQPYSEVKISQIQS